MKKNKKIKVMTVVGTRPEIIRLSRVIAVLNKYTDHVLVHTGQNYDYELNEVFFKDLGMKKPDYFLSAAGATPAATIGQVIEKVDPVMARENPEAVLILGDTNSCLAAIPAKRRKIPVFHMEAGNRCFDQRVPEEINRKIVDHISDLNMPYSSIAREYLLNEGFPADRIVKTGSPMFEVLNHYAPQIAASSVLKKLKLEPKSFFVVSAHREENVDSERNLERLGEILNMVAADYGRRVIGSTHPRTRKRFESRKMRFHKNVELLKPLGFSDYICLQKNAFAVLSDSGTITEEASILGFTGITMRETHERPEGMEEAAVIMTGLDPTRVKQAIEMCEGLNYSKSSLRTVADYTCPNVSEKVARIILSYTDYINRNVWRRSA